MLISFIHRWLTGPTEKFFSARNLFWFSLSLIFGAIFGVMALQEAFSQNYVVQDDARQHITWLFRFWDEDLFRGDFIADLYFLCRTKIPESKNRFALLRNHEF
jgi:hypothetical protein